MGMVKQGKNPTGKIVKTGKICKKCSCLTLVDQKDPKKKKASKEKCTCGQMLD